MVLSLWLKIYEAQDCVLATVSLFWKGKKAVFKVLSFTNRPHMYTRLCNCAIIHDKFKIDINDEDLKEAESNTLSLLILSNLDAFF